MSMVEVTRPIVGGVDTHLDVHVVAAVDPVGGLLGVKSFPTTPAGYHDLSGWLSSFGPVERVGVEGTGSYGAGLARHPYSVDMGRESRSTHLSLSTHGVVCSSARPLEPAIGIPNDRAMTVAAHVRQVARGLVPALRGGRQRHSAVAAPLADLERRPILDCRGRLARGVGSVLVAPCTARTGERT
jgi:transposase